MPTVGTLDQHLIFQRIFTFELLRVSLKIYPKSLMRAFIAQLSRNAMLSVWLHSSWRTLTHANANSLSNCPVLSWTGLPWIPVQCIGYNYSCWRENTAVACVRLLSLLLLMLISYIMNVVSAVITGSLINSLWPSDGLWWHRTLSVLVRAMAPCLAKPSHYCTDCELTSMGSVASVWEQFCNYCPSRFFYKIFWKLHLEITATFSIDYIYTYGFVVTYTLPSRKDVMWFYIILFLMIQYQLSYCTSIRKFSM